MNKYKDYKTLVDKYFSDLPEDAFEYVTCVVCNKDNGHPLFSKESMRVVRCECGLVYNKRQAKEKYLNKFYVESEALHSWAKIKTSNYEQIRQLDKYSKAVEFLKRNSVRSIADIGCGNGKFLKLIRDTYSPVDLHGFEINESAIKECGDLSIWRWTLEDFFLNSFRTYECISLWGVLEHLKNPQDAIEKLSHSIKTDGYLIICVPNVESLVIMTLWGKTFTFCPQHLWYFSKSTLETLLRRNGFGIDDYYTIEPEAEPYIKSLYGFDPYEDYPSWASNVIEGAIPLTSKTILEKNQGYKIVMIARKLCT